MTAASILATAALHQTQAKWDLPATYPSTSFHTKNLAAYAADIDRATGSELKFTVHANAKLFKATEIKRTVQSRQAQIGEISLTNFINEWPIYGADGLPFPADSYDKTAKLYKVQKPLLEKKLAEQAMMLL